MSITPPFVSACTAGLLILMQMALAGAVVLARRRNRQSLGDGGSADLLATMRRHGNFAENAALFIAGFTLLELIAGSGVGLQILCAAFVAVRISHAVGLSMKRTANPFRFIGFAGTIVVGVALGWRLLSLGLAHLFVG